MLYGIWYHYHATNKNDASNCFAHPTLFVGTKQEMAAMIRKLPLLSSSHRSYTVIARTPDLTDEGPNAICEQCGGPTRRTRDMMTVAEVWAETDA
jgi:hypothetical protein